MLQRLTMDGIELPRLYIAENKMDADLAMSKGIPFIRWTRGQEELIRILLRPVLEKMFPHIKWTKVLGPKRRFKTTIEIAEHAENKGPDQLDIVSRLDDIADFDESMSETWEPGYVIDNGATEDVMIDEDGNLTELSRSSKDERLFYSEGSDMMFVRRLDLQDYAGDLSSCVNLEVLQRLRLMPAFIGDILDCIKTNIGTGLYWREGYNKRLGIPVGRFDASRQLPNLVILDVSGSIPRGISATMIALIDTLRTQLQADLIITSTRSRFYPMGMELPDPQKLRNQFGYGNESYDFFGILNTHIRGKHYGHVFSFGDNDTPYYEAFFDDRGMSLAGTKVEFVHHYHTGHWMRDNGKTGYAKWCHMLASKPREEYDTDWCKVIKE